MLAMPTHKRFQVEEEDFAFSSSEDEEKLRKFREKQQQDEQSDSEVEVLDVGSDSAPSDDGDIALSDVEGQEDDDNLPDARAWGKEKKKYYGADYVDADYGGWGKEAHAAEIEEEEAKTLQNQLMRQLDDNDFSLDVVLKKPTKGSEKEEAKEVIKTDLSQLSNKQKLAIIKKESPEFFSLVDDFKSKMSVAKDYLKPILERVRSGKMEHCKTVDLVQTYYQLILTYSTNIYMYLLLKGNNKLKNHPVIQRLYQYRQLLSQIEPVFDEIVKPQIQWILGQDKQSEANSKIFRLLGSLIQPKEKENTTEERPKKKLKLDPKASKGEHVTFQSGSSGEESDMEVDKVEGNHAEDNAEEQSEETQGMAKRAVTYQISKNKGLTPHRKKELRNPRVKHKLKFRKALIRRKGAVREPRKELSRYGGELSGIKTSVRKSIKLQS